MDVKAPSASEHLLTSLKEFLLSWHTLWLFEKCSSHPAGVERLENCVVKRWIWLLCERYLRITMASVRWEFVSPSHNGTDAECGAGGRLCSIVLCRDPGTFHLWLSHPQRVNFIYLQWLNALSTVQPARMGKGGQVRASPCLLKIEPH